MAMTKAQIHAVETYQRIEGGDYKDDASDFYYHLLEIGYPVPDHIHGYLAPRSFMKWWHEQLTSED